MRGRALVPRCVGGRSGGGADLTWTHGSVTWEEQAGEKCTGMVGRGRIRERWIWGCRPSVGGMVTHWHRQSQLVEEPRRCRMGLGTSAHPVESIVGNAIRTR